LLTAPLRRSKCSSKRTSDPAPAQIIVSADEHAAIGIEQSSVQLLGGSEFYHLPMCIKYSS
jgi:hypothetical protein